MALSKEQHEFRLHGVGGSDATRIMKGDWHSLWLEKTGRAEREDLSDVLPVQMGIWTEEFNRQWFQKETGITVITAQTENLAHPIHNWMRANLDGYTAQLTSTDNFGEFNAERTGIFEAKHVNQFRSLEEVVQDYYAQLHHYMMVTDEQQATISVFFGNLRHEYHIVERDESYIGQLFEAEKSFWKCVKDDVEPENLAPKKKKVRLDGMKVRRYSSSPNWVRNATAWKENRPAVQSFKAAEKELKSMIDDDVRTAFGDGVYISRAKNGSLTIREMNEHKDIELTEEMDDEFQD